MEHGTSTTRLDPETGERMVSPMRSRQRSNSWTMNGPLTMAKTISETTSALMKSPR